MPYHEVMTDNERKYFDYCLVQLHGGGFEMQDIARITGLTKGEVRAAKIRGVRKMRKSLSKYLRGINGK